MRVERFVTKALRVLFDATVYEDNSWCVDVIYSNDIAFGTTGGKVTYGTTITTVNQPTISYPL